MTYPLPPVTRQQLITIYSNLGIDEDRHQKILELFKQWIASEPHLPNDLDDSYLSNYLVLCKDNLSKAKKKFETNIITRKFHSVLNYETFIPTDCFLQTNVARQFIMSPKLTPDGCRVAYIILPKTVQTFDLQTILKYALLNVDTHFFESTTSGLVIIADYGNCGIELVAKIDVGLLLQYEKFLLKCLPQRLTFWHVINTPPILKPIITMTRAILPEKIKKRIFFHDRVENLKDYLSEDLLPVEFGGTLPSLDDMAKMWGKYYEESEEWKEKLKKLRLRGVIPKEKLHLDPTSGFGTDGTFRNLQVD